MNVTIDAPIAAGASPASGPHDRHSGRIEEVILNRFALPLALGLLLFTGTAEASRQGQMVISNWNAADKCAKQAQAAYPDYSAEANAKRDAMLKECLSGGNLPPRQPLSQPPSR
jgi:hypothetical protein